METAGVRAAYLNSTQSYEEVLRVEKAVLENALDLGWQILADCFEKDETGMKSELIEEFWPEK